MPNIEKIHAIICSDCGWGHVKRGPAKRPRVCHHCGANGGRWEAYVFVALPLKPDAPKVVDTSDTADRGRKSAL